MKHVLKVLPEPEELRIYREKNSLNTWDQFKNEAPEVYEILRNELRKNQSGLCAYCEILLTKENEQIAHFHPKSDTEDQDKNWALDWDNLWLACKGGTQSWMENDEDNYTKPLPENRSCDENKTDTNLDNIILAPNMIPANPRIFQYKQQLDRIEIWPDEENCEIANLEIKKVSDTIEKLNLNCPRLSKARLKSYRQLEPAIKKLRESNIKDPKPALRRLAELHLKKDKNGFWPRFFTVFRWRLKDSAEEYLESINFQG